MQNKKTKNPITTFLPSNTGHITATAYAIQKQAVINLLYFSFCIYNPAATCDKIVITIPIKLIKILLLHILHNFNKLNVIISQNHPKINNEYTITVSKTLFFYNYML